jgi:hypothetical protein
MLATVVSLAVRYFDGLLELAERRNLPVSGSTTSYDGSSMAVHVELWVSEGTSVVSGSAS